MQKHLAGRIFHFIVKNISELLYNQPIKNRYPFRPGLKGHGLKADFVDVAKQAAALALEPGKERWDVVAQIVLTVPLLSCEALDCRDTSILGAMAMPDIWLQAVASLPQISDRAVMALCEALREKGFVSVTDALAVAEGELHLADSHAAPQPDRPGAPPSAEGAAMLLARAEKLAPGIIACIRSALENSPRRDGKAHPACTGHEYDIVSAPAMRRPAGSPTSEWSAA